MAFPFTGRVEVGCMFLAETTYVYYFVLRLRKGLPRLLALLPLLPVCLLVLWRVPTAFERTVCCGFFLWMLMVKLVLLAWDKGLAADSYALSSFPRFLYAIQAAVHLKLDPRFIKETDSRERSSQSNVPLSNGGKRSGAAVVAGKNDSRSGRAQVEDTVEVEIITIAPTCSRWIHMTATSQALHIVIVQCLLYYIVTVSLLRQILAWKDVLSEYELHLLLGFFTYFWFLLLFEMAVLLPASIVGTELPPLFNMPFLADSLGDFWGRRWNLLVINLLRVSVYEPMLRILSRGKKPSLADRVIATFATFLVSGIMHELTLFYARRSRPSWEMTTFFLLNGAGTIVERSIKAQSRFAMPRFIRRAYTLTFIYFTAHWFLFPPLIRNGLLDGMADLRVSSDGIERMIWLHLCRQRRRHPL